MENQLKKGYQRVSLGNTKRYCQFLKLNAARLKEYKHWHTSQNIWAEIPKGIREVGILDMEIYLISDMAFMIVETEHDFDWDKAFAALASLDRQQEWEDFVAQYQLGGDGKRSEEKWVLMERAFSLIEALKI